MTAELPYLSSYKNVARLLEKIEEAKIPDAFHSSVSDRHDRLKGHRRQTIDFAIANDGVYRRIGQTDQ